MTFSAESCCLLTFNVKFLVSFVVFEIGFGQYISCINGIVCDYLYKTIIRHGHRHH